MKPGNLMKIKVPNPAARRKMRIRFVTHIESVDVCFCIYGSAVSLHTVAAISGLTNSERKI